MSQTVFTMIHCFVIAIVTDSFFSDTQKLPILNLREHPWTFIRPRFPSLRGGHDNNDFLGGNSGSSANVSGYPRSSFSASCALVVIRGFCRG